MASDSVILRFADVSFGYVTHKPLLEEVSFSVRAGSRITLMGQNGAGKSSLFKLITGEVKPEDGRISITPQDASVAIARQVMPKESLELTLREYFAEAFGEKKYNLDRLISDVFDIVHLDLPLDKKVGEFSGGQQARLLLAHALIQNPDVLLLDEPMNNLDQYGIEHLTGFLMMYEKTVIVISHDEEFLNAFSDGVLYLDGQTRKVEQYTGNYIDVVEEIKKRMERENYQNARMQTQIREKRAQAEVFAHKGGKMRGVAKRMREAAEDAEENLVDVRSEDRKIREFSIPAQELGADVGGKIVHFTSIFSMRDGQPKEKRVNVIVGRRTHALIAEPNGIGKSTLLEKLAAGEGEGFVIAPEVKVGYYKQDFSNFDMEQIAYDALGEVME
ncbi:MAG: ABC-F family ATP-binding cassette domain-containing protein [Candidatus Andersenbacteria bacterium]|nr:ABC-F family ATP-binding cassette domain-containing protein [Candidatus Andersenbacteria bacterium]